MKSRRTLTSVAIASLLLLGACGGGDDTGSSGLLAGGDTTKSTTASGSSTGSTDFTGKNSGEFCKYAKQIEQDSAFGDSFMESTDAKTMKDDLKKAQDVFSTAIGKAPSEIKPDMQTMQKALKSLSDLMSGYDYDMAKMTAAVEKDPNLAAKLEAFSSTEFEQASERVDAYFSQVCGIDTDN
jgi:hypothetical protein